MSSAKRMSFDEAFTEISNYPEARMRAAANGIEYIPSRIFTALEILKEAGLFEPDSDHMKALEIYKIKIERMRQIMRDDNVRPLSPVEAYYIYTNRIRGTMPGVAAAAAAPAAAAAVSDLELSLEYVKNHLKRKLGTEDLDYEYYDEIPEAIRAVKLLNMTKRELEEMNRLPSTSDAEKKTKRNEVIRAEENYRNNQYIIAMLELRENILSPQSSRIIQDSMDLSSGYKSPEEQRVQKRLVELFIDTRREQVAREEAAREQAARERAEREARERAEREAREARERAERERAEREARERAEREAREREARERAEREELLRIVAEAEQRERRSEADQIARQVPAAGPQLTGDDEDIESKDLDGYKEMMLCGMCRVNIKTVKISPCGHMICKTCARRNIERGVTQCPYRCDKRITSYDRVFLSKYLKYKMKYLQLKENIN